MTLPAEAGRRHCRSCSTSSGGAAGGWYHFTSGGGSYVPFAPQTTVSTYDNGAALSDCGRPATYHHVTGPVYGASHIQPLHDSAPSGCRNCRTW
jgi:hypothetical protein